MYKFFLVFFLSFFLTLTPTSTAMPRFRNLEFDYKILVEDIPRDASGIKIWLPYIPQTPYQEIEAVKFNPEGIAQVADDKIYHNKIIFYSFKSPKDFVEIDVHYKVRRYEYSKKAPTKNKHKADAQGDLAKYLVSNRLMIITPEIKEMAAYITKGKNTAMEKARAIYDYVFENVSYDKTIPGWGNGDTQRVCIIKAGNCTDFHSLFISLARACSIPAKFVIGVLVPKEEGGEIESYHCWAEFYDKQLGWVPVDISEAWKDKTKQEYYFGNISEDRIEFSQGRDIVLEPLSHSEPLNYFFYPYAEVDGKNFKNVEVSFRFKERR